QRPHPGCQEQHCERNRQVIRFGSRKIGERMDEKKEPGRVDVRSLIKQALDEFTRTQQAKVESAYKIELEEERKRREHLERRVNDLIQENKRSRQIAEEAERSSAIKSELQRLGVGKVDLAFKEVKDDVVRAEDG